MRLILIVSAFYGLTGVILGAFGAHALKDRLNPAQLLSYETGVRYQLIHAVAMMVVAMLAGSAGSSLLKWAGQLFAVGVFLFSFSIYLLATREMTGLVSWKWLGPVTPLGGLCLISGWLILLVWAIRQKS